MQITGIAGNIAGLPLKGGVVSLGAADAAGMIGATAGLVKILSLTGAGVIGAAVLYALIDVGITRKNSQVPIAALAGIRTWERQFTGICHTENLEFTSEGNKLNVPLTCVGKLNIYRKRYGLLNHRTRPVVTVELVDQSRFTDVDMTTTSLSFLTVAGTQTVPIQQAGTVIEGVSWSDVQMLRQRLRFVLEHNLEAIVETLGEDVVSKYFGLRL